MFVANPGAPDEILDCICPYPLMIDFTSYMSFIVYSTYIYNYILHIFIIYIHNHTYVSGIEIKKDGWIDRWMDSMGWDGSGMMG